MSNLFALADENGHFFLNGDSPLYFANKQDAKIKRQSLNGTDKDGNEVFTWVVARGPDHDGGPRQNGYTSKRGSGGRRSRKVAE